MKGAMLVILLSANVAAAAVIQNGKDEYEEQMYKVASEGPVLGHVIYSIYEEATKFCSQQNKEVATVELKQDEGPQSQFHKWLSAELTFKCALKTTQCSMTVPEGATTYALREPITLKDGTVVHSGDMRLKDGAVIHPKQCSDAERVREPPPP